MSGMSDTAFAEVVVAEVAEVAEVVGSLRKATSMYCENRLIIMSADARMLCTFVLGGPW